MKAKNPGTRKRSKQDQYGSHNESKQRNNIDINFGSIFDRFGNGFGSQAIERKWPCGMHGGSGMLKNCLKVTYKTKTHI